MEGKGQAQLYIHDTRLRARGALHAGRYRAPPRGAAPDAHARRSRTRRDRVCALRAYALTHICVSACAPAHAAARTRRGQGARAARVGVRARASARVSRPRDTATHICVAVSALVLPEGPHPLSSPGPAPVLLSLC